MARQAAGGTTTVRLVGVAAVTCARIPFRKTSFIEGEEASKPVHVIVSVEPGMAMLGVNPVIVGGADASSANCWTLVEFPLGLETYTVPSTAPERGTVTTSWDFVADVTVAIVVVGPPNRTVFWPAVALNPAP